MLDQAPNPQEDQSDPLGQMAHKEDCNKAMEEMEQLPDHLKQILLLKIIGGMTLRQIAETTGLTPGNAGYRLNQGLSELAERLKAKGVI